MAEQMAAEDIDPETSPNGSMIQIDVSKLIVKWNLEAYSDPAVDDLDYSCMIKWIERIIIILTINYG